MLTLVDELRSVAGDCGFQVENRDFVPHVTLARKVRKLPHQWREITGPDIRWPVNDFVLVRSQTRAEGVEYEAVGSWPLQQ